MKAILALCVVCATLFLMSEHANDFETPSIKDAKHAAHIAATFKAACDKRGGEVVEYRYGNGCRVKK